MKERPILFSAPMVRAILVGTKTQTRRVVSPLCADRINHCPGFLDDLKHVSSPYGQPGDRLWVREAWMDLHGTGVEHRDRAGKLQRCAYRADTPPGSYGDEARKDFGLRWRPSIYMPRWASRITLEVTGVRVERLCDISAQDCLAEGIGAPLHADESWTAGLVLAAVNDYKVLWESINGPGSWQANPWVWVVEFQRLPSKESP